MRFLTNVADHQTGGIIWSAPGRTGATLEEFFELLGDRKDSIRAVSIDMSEPYAGTIRRSLPNAQIAFDPFHVIALAGVAVDQVRRQHSHTMGGHLKAGEVWIKHARWALLKAPEKLDHRQQLALAQIQATNRLLYRAYLLKEQLRALYQLQNPADAPAHLAAWLAWASRSKLKPFLRLARTLRRYRAGILAAIRLGLTNECVSYCTSWCVCSGDAVGGGTGTMMTGSGESWAGRGLVALSAVGRAGLAGVVEVEAAAVDPAAGDVAAALPDLDRVGGDAELRGDLLEREHPLGAEAVAVGRDAAVLAELGERGDGERLAPAAGQPALVKDLDRLVVGVLVEQLLDHRDRRGWRGVLLPRTQWPWQLQCVLLAA